MTKSQRRFAAALQAAGYSATEATKAAAPTTTATTRTRTRRAPVQRASYAADAHPWAHDEE
jgi:hypothetical protein